MQVQMTQKEKFVYGFLALAAVLMTIEYKYQPVAITVDVAHYAAERISGHQVKHTASIAPKTMSVAKTRSTKSSSPASDSYTVSHGETLYEINRKYDGKVDIKATCALNGLGPKCETKAGQHITLAMRH